MGYQEKQRPDYFDMREALRLSGIEAVTQLGLRVGCYQNDGVVDYYIFKEDKT